MSAQGAMRLMASQQGKRIAFGTVTPTNSNHLVTTGLSDVEYCYASLAAAPTINMNAVHVDPAVNGGLRIFSYKPTGAADLTPAPAAANWVAVSWIAIGT